jgi:hypothetical protein
MYKTKHALESGFKHMKGLAVRKRPKMEFRCGICTFTDSDYYMAVYKPSCLENTKVCVSLYACISQREYNFSDHVSL